MEAPPKRWKKRPPLKLEQLAELDAALPDRALSPLLLQLLVNRDVIRLAELGEDPAASEAMRAEVEAFLDPGRTPLPSPFTISGMEAAVARTALAVKSGEKIGVYGDYDADGVTSTTLLTQALRAWGAEVVIHVPHRKRDGYGVNKAALDGLADQGVKLVITVDCGIGNADEVKHGQERGLDMIVTDHHILPRKLPNTILINPKQGGERDPFYWLAGVGVAHQLVRGLVERIGKPPVLRNNELLELVAIGTVADVVPLLGANRALVALGIHCLRATRRPGLLALLQAAGVQPGAVTAHHIGFIIGPRLNAAGRLDDAKVAYDLLLTSDAAEAADLAGRLQAENVRRQELTREIMAAAEQQVAELDQDDPLIILRDPAWDVGVVGLAAGRLCEEYGRPTFVFVDEGESSRGSARSTRHFDIHKMLTFCDDLLGHYGGHAMAAGLSLPNANFADFRERMRELVESELSDPAQLAGELNADYELPLEEATLETVAALSILEPCGNGNLRPLFVARNLRLIESKANGKEGRTLVLTLAPPAAEAPRVRAFSHGIAAEWLPKLASKPKVDVMFHLKVNDWNGRQNVELEIRGLRLAKET